MAEQDAEGGVSEPAVTTEWPQWGGSGERNNTPVGTNIPAQWDIGGFDRRTGEWLKEDAENIKWVSRVGSQTYGNPVVAGGQVFVGTNNGAGYLARYPNHIDLGCLLAFRESDGQFLWQHSSEKLPTGRVHDWPLQGICCAPLVEGERLWFVTSRGEVVCVDTQGFHDGQDDGPITGPWAPLFQESPAIAAGLDDGDVSDALRASLAEAGVSLPQRPSVKANIKAEDWRMTVRDPEGSTSFYAIQRQDDQLAVYRLEAEDSQPAGDPVLRVPSLLSSGLEDGNVSDGLRNLLAQRGMRLPEKVELKAEKPGSSWMLTANIDGKQRQIRISRAGPNLTAMKQITVDDKQEADTIWVLDMMKELGVSQHNMCSCSVTALGDILFVCTSNGVDESHINLPALDAPSFIAVDKNSGDVLWTDKSPGTNILHGQWSSPAVGVLGGVPQVVFPGGDGWLYSFRADAGKNGSPELLWKFDTNPKQSEWILGGRGTRNNIIATPVLYEDRVYVAVGQDPEHGEWTGHLWCIDPTRRGNVSPQLAMKLEGNRRVEIPPRRLQAVDPEKGEIAVDNPNSAVIWHYSQFDQNGDGEYDFEEVMHRSCGTVAIKDNILYIADFSGLFHCLDAESGKVHWTYDMLAAAWGSPLIVDDKVYIGDEDGDVSVFEHSTEPQEPVAENYMNNSVYSTPVVANNVLYISNKTHLFAIEQPVE
jgi:outer membrane protein assembly factor BamB